MRSSRHPFRGAQYPFRGVGKCHGLAHDTVSCVPRPFEMTLSGFEGRPGTFDISPDWFDIPAAGLAAGPAYIEVAGGSFEA